MPSKVTPRPFPPPAISCFATAFLSQPLNSPPKKNIPRASFHSPASCKPQSCPQKSYPDPLSIHYYSPSCYCFNLCNQFLLHSLITQKHFQSLISLPQPLVYPRYALQSHSQTRFSSPSYSPLRHFWNLRTQAILRSTIPFRVSHNSQRHS